jgi:glycosyltransferase involved in cell wall biosynthesis
MATRARCCAKCFVAALARRTCTAAALLAISGASIRILIITYAFPPLNAIAAHRPYSWAKVWRDLGHEVEVLTFAKHALDGAMDLERDLGGIKVHEVGYLPVQRAAATSKHKAERWETVKAFTRRVRFALGSFGDVRLFAYRPLLRQGLRRCAERRFDLIVATSPPDVIFLVARRLSQRTGIPWVADFRDLWFHDMVLYRSRIAAAFAGPLNRWLVSNAALLVTVSQGLQARLQRYLGREVLLSFNGFLEEDQRDVAPSADAKRHVVYTGRVYPGKQDPQPLLRALARLRRQIPELASRLSIDFYGFEAPQLRAMAARHSVEDCVRLLGFVPYRNSIAAQRTADALLFLDWMELGAEGMMTGKLFEYLGSRRPILALGPRKDSEAARLIAAAGAGTLLTSDDEIVEYLRRLLASPRLADLPAHAVARFSRERQAAELLREILPRLQT